MKCVCGVENLSTSKFCKGCGSKLEALPVKIDAQKSCPSCQATLKADAKFCNQCGYKFGAAPTMPAPIPAPKTEVATKPCASCGFMVKVGAKFCGNCGKSPDAPPAAPPKLAAQTESNDAAMTDETTVEVKQAIEKAPESPAQPNQDEVRENETKLTEAPEEIKKNDTPAATVSQAGTTQTTVEAPAGSNKKIIIIAAITLALTAGAAAAWLTLSKDKAAPASTVEAATPSASTPADTASTAPQPTARPLAESFIGKSVKDGATLDGFSFEISDKSKNFILLTGEPDAGGAPVVVVTNAAGMVLESKDVTNLMHVLMSGEKACAVNKKPYGGIYVMSAVDKLSPPSAVWKLTEEGKFVDQTVANIECSATLNCVGETDNCAYIGYNEQQKAEATKAPPVKATHKKEVVQKNKTPAKQTQSKSADEPASQHTEQTAPPPAPATEPAPTESQETATPEEPKKKKKKGLGGFFDKLGESVKQGTEGECTSAQRALNQCSN